MTTEAKCPFHQTSGKRNHDWWPNQLNLKVLHQQGPLSDPMGESFDYEKEFASLDYAGVKQDLRALMTDSQEWWPADFGHYGPLFIRMAWHSAGTYRIHDGRGGGGAGQQRFAPLNSWPDNVNLDKARRLLWPIKAKYGRKLSWADLMIPAVNHPLVDAQDIASLKAKVLGSGLSVSQLVSTAWASASTFRGSDKRGGANGARIRLAPQKDWAVNQPAQLATVLSTLEGIQREFNASAGGGKQVSLADLIVLAGAAGVEQAAKNAGVVLTVPFTPGRMDASPDETDVQSFAAMESQYDGFRNYVKRDLGIPAEALLVDKAQLLTLTAPEMTVLLGGLRVLNTNVGQSQHGVFTQRPGALTNDFFVNLLDMRTEWKPAPNAQGVYEGRNRKTGELEWTGTRVDLVFGSHSQLRALAEVYASKDAQEKFVRDFVAAWDKVMNLDRYDLA